MHKPLKPCMTDPSTAKKQAFKTQVRLHKVLQENNTQLAEQITMRLLASEACKVDAVFRVTYGSLEQQSPGPDGKRYGTDKEKTALARRIDLSHPYSPTKTCQVPKKLTSATRTIEVSNYEDRAREKMLEMVITPWVELHLAPQQFGFRPGRSQQDAIAYLRLRLSGQKVKWVVDADIAKYFDDIPHSVITQALQDIKMTPTVIEHISSWLDQRDELKHSQNNKTERGLPQGSPLSPVLANLVLRNLPNKLRLGKGNHIVIYADDLVFLSNNQQGAEEAKASISNHLRELGVSLSQEKTSIRHTKEGVNGFDPGFYFLGIRFWHAKTWKHGELKDYALALPTQESCKELRAKLKQIVKETCISKKYRNSKKKGQDGSFEGLITQLNQQTLGWAYNLRHTNAKKTFSKIDHYIHRLLQKKANKVFKDKSRAWIFESCFNGISRDSKGNPLKRKNGEERDRSWVFQDPLYKGPGHPVTVRKLADITVGTFTMVKFSRHYFDGDWVYWNGRRKQRYLGTPPDINASAIRRQKGKCPLCKDSLIPLEVEITSHIDSQGVSYLIHSSCSQQK